MEHPREALGSLLTGAILAHLPSLLGGFSINLTSSRRCWTLLTHVVPLTRQLFPMPSTLGFTPYSPFFSELSAWGGFSLLWRHIWRDPQRPSSTHKHRGETTKSSQKGPIFFFLIEFGGFRWYQMGMHRFFLFRCSTTPRRPALRLRSARQQGKCLRRRGGALSSIRL
ncbi:hypothetical protein B0T25DRAFT_312891 [Lasiosphaeria hispida]|uniref:Uncharacterized protein n=1 Tax=Lasiosphaeria hispida TaxID=260671 RepID=A0AAJ0H9F2_9PEZI|nr:hypothetical protein B0T25DRAFT_312891 [Lasiosphaeria hispida]